MQVPSLIQDHMARSRADPRGASSQGDQRNWGPGDPRGSPEEGGIESTGDIVTAAAPSSGEGLGHFVPRSEPPGTSITQREEEEGQGSKRTWGCPEDLFVVYHSEQWPPTHPTRLTVFIRAVRSGFRH